MRKVIFFTLAIFYTVGLKAAIYDSLGVEKRGDKVFVLHRVEAGETVYAIGRKYGSSVLELVKNNPDATPDIKIGQILKVPYNNNNNQVSIEPVNKKESGVILHEVKQSETLYSISRKYNVSIDDILKWNKLEVNNISIGQRLSIAPNIDTAVDHVVEKKPVTHEIKKGIRHTVEQGETLYAISRKYGVTIQQLQDWNELSDNNLDIGSEIVIGELASVEEQETVAPQEETKEPIDIEKVVSEKVETSDSSAPSTVVEKVETASSEVSRKPEKIVLETTKEETTKRHEKKTESGLAEMIDGSNKTKKYLAMHKTAPIGTIMQVKNEMNGLSVFVRVIGKLPDISENDKLILKISEKAYERLGALDKRFRVKIIYAP